MSGKRILEGRRTAESRKVRKIRNDLWQVLKGMKEDTTARVMVTHMIDDLTYVVWLLEGEYVDRE